MGPVLWIMSRKPVRLKTISSAKLYIYLQYSYLFFLSNKYFYGFTLFCTICLKMLLFLSNVYSDLPYTWSYHLKRISFIFFLVGTNPRLSTLYWFLIKLFLLLSLNHLSIFSSRQHSSYIHAIFSLHDPGNHVAHWSYSYSINSLFKRMSFYDLIRIRKHLCILTT